MIALSKSRFKQGLECPNKLYFSNNEKMYHNVKNNDPFLQALASGGFQVANVKWRLLGCGCQEVIAKLEERKEEKKLVTVEKLKKI